MLKGLCLENSITINHWSKRHNIIVLLPYRFTKLAITGEDIYIFHDIDDDFKVTMSKVLKCIFIETKTPEQLFKIYKRLEGCI